MNGPTANLRKLIDSSIDTIESLEILLLLRRSHHAFWSAQAVAEQLGIEPQVARAKLAAMHGNGLLTIGEQSHAYRYAPVSAELAEAVAGVEDEYSKRRANVVNAIYSANLERLRAFSDAFKVK